MDKKYKKFLKKVLEFREYGDLRHRDITVLVALLQKLEFDDFNDIKNKRVVNLTGLDKSDVSKSLKALKGIEIILEDEDQGYKLNEKLILD